MEGAAPSNAKAPSTQVAGSAKKGPATVAAAPSSSKPPAKKASAERERSRRVRPADAAERDRVALEELADRLPPVEDVPADVAADANHAPAPEPTAPPRPLEDVRADVAAVVKVAMYVGGALVARKTGRFPFKARTLATVPKACARVLAHRLPVGFVSGALFEFVGAIAAEFVEAADRDMASVVDAAAPAEVRQ